jgi:hypothetical protein
MLHFNYLECIVIGATDNSATGELETCYHMIIVSFQHLQTTAGQIMTTSLHEKNKVPFKLMTSQYTVLYPLT